MDAETWMNANKAVELGFADGILEKEDRSEDVETTGAPMMYSEATVVNSLMGKIAEKCRIAKPQAASEPDTPAGRSVDELVEKLNAIKKYI